MRLYIKYMVSNRCKIVVREKLETLGLLYDKVELGEVHLKNNITFDQLELLKYLLGNTGLEVIEDRIEVLIEKIKNVVIEMVHVDNEVINVNNSSFISEQLNHKYRYLAKIFSEKTGTTIEHYIIAQKIEKIKEYISYDELNLTQISIRLNYSSVAHLSYQFKKVTGLTPSYFKLLANKNRRALDHV